MPSTDNRAEAAARVGCGALIGLLVAASLVVRFAAEFDSVTSIALLAVVTVVVCVILALRHGDRFAALAVKFFAWFR